MPVFVLNVTAIRNSRRRNPAPLMQVNVDITVEMFILAANSKDEATGAAVRKTREKYPPSDGWREYTASRATELARERLAEHAEKARKEREIPEGDRVLLVDMD